MLFHKKYPKLLLTLSFLTLVVIVCIFINFKNIPVDNESLNQLLFEKIEDRSIKSIVTEKKIDYSNHGATYIIFENDSLPTHTILDEKINVGDSIIKSKGSLKLILKNNSKEDTLDYQNAEDEVLKTNF